MSSVWDAKYNPEPSELEVKVISYEARIKELEAESARLRQECAELCGYDNWEEVQREKQRALLGGGDD